jgi:hypothetical protein
MEVHLIETSIHVKLNPSLLLLTGSQSLSLKAKKTCRVGKVYLYSTNHQNCQSSKQKEHNEVEQRNLSKETLISIADISGLCNRDSKVSIVVKVEMKWSTSSTRIVTRVLTAKASRRQCFVIGSLCFHLLNLKFVQEFAVRD